MAVGDTYRYLNGVEYVETDGGPNVWAICYLCGATAACTLQTKVKDIRCGVCFARARGLLPGQEGYTAQQEWRAGLKKAS